MSSARQLILSTVRSDKDVVVVRRQAKKIAELCGLGSQDQVRLATAISEIARNLVARGSVVQVELSFQHRASQPMLIARIKDEGAALSVLQVRAPDATAVGPMHVEGLAAAQRLVDHYEVTLNPQGGGMVELGKRSTAKASAISAVDIARALRETAAESAVEATALRNYDQELIASLAEVADKQTELSRLEQELHDTNRGVVALYAELDEKAEQLRAASEAKSRFLTNVSHELRTPLNSILALSRLLLDRVDGPLEVEQERQVAFIRGSAVTLLEFVNDLLDLAKVEAGKVDLVLSEICIAELFASLRGVLKPLKASPSVDLIFEEPEHIVVFSDEGKIAQILRNLIGNALKYTEHGEVRVSALRDLNKGTVMFVVADTGIGISAADQQRIFKEFEQVAGGFQQKHKGSGLGLALSLTLAKLLRGELSVTSSVGSGSTFRLCVPIDHRRPGSFSAAVEGASNRKRVLVVDDEETFRYVVRHILESDPNYELIEAANGVEGLGRARTEQPDVIVLDLQMPVIDGFHVLTELGQDPSTRGIPVIVSTSLKTDVALQQRLSRASAVLSKSALSREVLLSAIGQALVAQ